MKIAIIGSGNVGSALGKRFSELKHEVYFGLKDPDDPKVQELKQSFNQGTLHFTTVASAIDAGDLVLLAIPWSAAGEVTALIKDKPGKVIVDCINPLNYEYGFKELHLGTTTSAAEKINEWTGTTPVVKAFNTTGAGNMLNPNYGDQKVTMYVAGDDPEAKKTVLGLASDLGFEPVDTGNLYTARFLEPLANLWVHQAYVVGDGPDFAINIIKRS